MSELYKPIKVYLNKEFQTKLNTLAKSISGHNHAQGFWKGNEQDETLDHKGLKIALIHSEVSEVLEALRKPGPDDKIPHRSGEEAELADVFIRLLDYCGRFGIDLGGVVEDKLAFNATRPKMHGKTC